MGISLSSSIAVLVGVGPAIAKRMENLSIHTVEDLLWHVPFRYDDFRDSVPIAALMINQTATVRVSIDRIANRRSPRRGMMLTEALVSDDSGTLAVVWFNQPFLEKNLQAGGRVVLSGKVQSRNGTLQMVAPAYEKERDELLHVGRLVPIYPTTAGLSQRQLRYFIQNALRTVAAIPDPLPEKLRRDAGVVDLDAALRSIHFPHDELERDAALHRLKFDELLLFQLRRRRTEREAMPLSASSIPFLESAVKRFIARLPFTLTAGQKRAAWDVLQDMMKEKPMHRLVEGDVGSGKTVVAAIAAWNALAAGWSVALMAPTEILAHQHFTSFSQWMRDTDTPVMLVTSGFHERSVHGTRMMLSRSALANALSASDQPHIIIGTHALLEERIPLDKLGLVVIDEQQRFGVAQRDALRKKNPAGHPLPHVLTLTATPIPRTLALALAGDITLSLIPMLPGGRKPIFTKLITPQQRVPLYRTVDAACVRGRQAFVIAPLIDPSDKPGVTSVTELYEELGTLLPNRKVGLLHGKFSSAEKERALADFAARRTDILVATSVIEVGIDVPNASLMVIEGAERFGLAQLHQIRGRVGRGQHQSYCYLVAGTMTPLAQKRLQAVATTTDGFRLAELDLELRGPGDLAGVLQAGFLDFQFASLGDHEMIRHAANVAESILESDPQLQSLPLLRRKIHLKAQSTEPGD